MSKASEWADQYRKRTDGRPFFETTETTGLKVAHVADNGTLEFLILGLPTGLGPRMLPSDAVEFGRWLIDTFMDKVPKEQLKNLIKAVDDLPSS